MLDRTLTAWVLGLCLVTTGCTSRLPKQEEAAPRPYRVAERNVITKSKGVIEESVSSSFVVSNDDQPSMFNEERVRWMEGVPKESSRIQRAPKISNSDFGAGGPSADQTFSQAQTSSVFFELSAAGTGFSAQAEMERINFIADASRYLVELYLEGEIDPDASMAITDSWRSLLERLVEKGLDPKKIVMTGIQYGKEKSGILLIKLVN